MSDLFCVPCANYNNVTKADYFVWLKGSGGIYTYMCSRHSMAHFEQTIQRQKIILGEAEVRLPRGVETMNEEEATKQIDETIAKYKSNHTVKFNMIGVHDRMSEFSPGNWYSWLLLSDISLFQEEKDGPWYGSDGNIYELELS